MGMCVLDMRDQLYIQNIKKKWTVLLDQIAASSLISK